MPTQEEYERATRELANLCGFRCRVHTTPYTGTGYEVTIRYLTKVFGSESWEGVRASSWEQALATVCRMANHRNIPLPPSSQSFLAKGE